MAKQWCWASEKPLNVAVLASGAPEVYRLYVGASSDACGGCGGGLEVLSPGLASFFSEAALFFTCLSSIWTFF